MFLLLLDNTVAKEKLEVIGLAVIVGNGFIMNLKV